MGRATTGTPPRINAKTIDYGKVDLQRPDKDIQPFNFVHEFNGFKSVNKTIHCYIT